jgi:hypothetical protein
MEAAFGYTAFHNNFSDKEVRHKGLSENTFECGDAFLTTTTKPIGKQKG